jgi:hypothetical protein
MDESNAITWLRYLLDIADLKRNGLLEQQKKVAEFLDRTIIRPVDFRSFRLQTSTSPTGAPHSLQVRPDNVAFTL